MDLVRGQYLEEHENDAAASCAFSAHFERLKLQTILRFADGVEMLFADDSDGETEEANAARVAACGKEIDRRRKSGRVRYTLGCAAMMTREKA